MNREADGTRGSSTWTFRRSQADTISSFILVNKIGMTGNQLELATSRELGMIR